MKSFAIEEGKTSSTLIVKVFHLADLWGEISMDLEVVLISGKIQDLMACGKKFFSSPKLAKGDRKGIQGERDGLSLPFPFEMYFSNNKYIFRVDSLCSILVNDGKET